MDDSTSEAQASRTARVTVTVTPAEKKAVKAVAAARDTDESNLLRVMPIDDVVAEYARIRELVGTEAA